MALINENNKYIKLNKDGSYEIYENIEARTKYKNATPSETILNKYNEILEEAYKKMYDKVISLGITNKDYEEGWEHYYSLVSKDAECKNYVDTYFEILEESNKYYNDLLNKNGAKNEYPIMEKIYSDIKDSIPNIIEAGCSYLDMRDTTEETYNNCKAKKRFGETKDC